MKAWNSVCIVACLLVVVLGYMKFREVRADRSSEIQIYNQWMQLMLTANENLSSVSRNEKPKKNSFYQNPNAALIEADKYFNMATGLANGAGSTFRGRLANVDGYLSSVSSLMSQELGYMYDLNETFVNGRYKITTPMKLLIADRNFMQHQLSSVLKGMPESATNVGQIEAQVAHFKRVESNLGVFGNGYEKFMESTGQMKQG